jgi:SAM-dependent methyltransferase
MKNLLKAIIPVSIRRLIKSYTYNKEKFLLKSHDDVFTKIYKTNFWNLEESKSGGGSSFEGTKTIRRQIPIIIEKYKIKSILDSPCGDFNWMKTVEKNCNYIGGDIVDEIIKTNQKQYGSEKIKFLKLNIANDDLPKVDLIFCKDFVQHLSNENVFKSIQNFKRSGSKYLLITSYPKTIRNYDIYDGDYRALNLLKKPFNFPQPLLVIEERSKFFDVEVDKSMYLYEIKSL